MIKRIITAALSGLMVTCMVITACAAANTYKCSCGIKTTSTLDVSSTRDVAAISIDDSFRGVSVPIYGEFWRMIQ